MTTAFDTVWSYFQRRLQYKDKNDKYDKMKEYNTKKQFKKYLDTEHKSYKKDDRCMSKQVLEICVKLIQKRDKTLKRYIDERREHDRVIQSQEITIKLLNEKINRLQQNTQRDLYVSSDSESD
jgi:hypothetical protein